LGGGHTWRSEPVEVTIPDDKKNAEENGESGRRGVRTPAPHTTGHTDP
jgi:hypothetical protein